MCIHLIYHIFSVYIIFYIYYTFSIGQAGDWKNWFTEEQNEEFDRKFEEWNKERQIPFIFE